VLWGDKHGTVLFTDRHILLCFVLVFYRQFMLYTVTYYSVFCRDNDYAVFVFVACSALNGECCGFLFMMSQVGHVVCTA